MTQALVTIAANIDVADVPRARELIANLGNPAKSIATAIETGAARFVHFASLHAIVSRTPNRAYLLLELSADGADKDAVEQFAERTAKDILPIFQLASSQLTADNLGSFLWRKRLNPGFSYFNRPGLAHSGTPHQTVGDILREDQLAQHISTIISGQGEFASSLARLADLRRQLEADPLYDWALSTTPREPQPVSGEPSLVQKGLAVVGPLITRFLWPVLIVAGLFSAWLVWTPGATANKIVLGVLVAIGLTILAVLAAALLFYLSFLREEDADWISNASPTPEQASAFSSRENSPGFAHNHMISHTERKPGWVRAVTVRLAFMVIAKLTALNPRQGYLGDIGTIHFARWVTVPGTRDLIFFSNYGGSWESYLEDFITKAHAGLTAVWSNTVGFPKTKSLFLDGATNGERFKGFARESMLPTLFWYSAYPHLTTANIRTNALIRRGLLSTTEAEAGKWLTLFGSAPRPAGKLDTPQIQSIVFGGLGFKPAGRVVTVKLSDDIGANRAWLQQLLPDMSFNDGRYIAAEAVITFSVTASGLTKLGLAEDALRTFPAAFQSGMCGGGRARILGDDDDRAHWWWSPETIDAALLVYGNDEGAVDRLTAKIEAALGGDGSVLDKIDLTLVGDKLVDRKEPFGFVDGVSQPAIRGTYRGLRNADPIHLVEPGEILLGYPDNRGSIPPSPLLQARYDPEMVLPIAGDDAGFSQAIAANPRLIGINGTFLVIRQLEQNRPLFDAYCDKQAKDFAHHFPAPAFCDAEFIAAKMIGRWRDGSSLVRNPYMSATRLQELYGTSDAGTAMREKAKPADTAATPVEPADRAGASPAKAPRPDNDFLFGTEDPQGLRCPYGAHVRRANPRDSLSPGSMEQVEITNRHRILRIGRGFAAQGDRHSGLMFMCLNADIERQFEFIQQTWMSSIKFHGLSREIDPIAGRGKEGSDGFTVPVRTGPVALAALPEFVTLRGGGYFFVPGRQLIRYLATV